MKNIVAVAVLFTIGILACGSPEAQQAQIAEQAEESPSAESFARMEAMEDSVYGQKTFDPRGVYALHDVYKAHIARFPKDTLAPHVLLRAGSTARQLNMAENAVSFYDRIINEHPEWYRVADAAYMKAFTLDDKLGNKEEAEKAYKAVIANYPDHQFAKDAKAMLENLHLTDAELIKKFEEMNKQQAN